MTTSATTASQPQQPPPSTFPLFSELDAGLQLTIFSFLADAPFEPQHNGDQPQSFLTHTLPLVNQQCRAFAEMDLLWKPALVRQARNEPLLWRRLMYQILGEEEPSSQEESSQQQEIELDDTTTTTTTTKYDTTSSSQQKDPKSKSTSSSSPLPSWQAMEQLVERARAWDDYPSFKAMYRYLFRSRIRFVGPVFMMGGPVTMGEAYGLHFFEPRYRILIAEVMQGRRTDPESGRVLTDDALFIHANRAMTPHATAVLVRVVHCHIYPDGRADVELLPVAYVRLERTWVRQDSGHLHYAQALRLGHEATENMNQTSLREAYIMAMSGFLRMEE